MNKSKFLKKSLAMLLALMLVVAMIPLSASASAPNLQQVRATADGETVLLTRSDDTFTGTYRSGASEVTLQVEVARDNLVYYTDLGTTTSTDALADPDKNNDNLWTIKNLDVRDYTNDDGNVEVNFSVADKDDPTVRENYTVVLEPKVASTDARILDFELNRFNGNTIPNWETASIGVDFVSVTMPYDSKGTKYTIRNMSVSKGAEWTIMRGTDEVASGDDTGVVNGENMADNETVEVKDEDVIYVKNGNNTVPYTLHIDIADGFATFETAEGLDAVLFPESDSIVVLLPFGTAADAKGGDITVTPEFTLDYPSASASWGGKALDGVDDAITIDADDVVDGEKDTANNEMATFDTFEGTTNNDWTGRKEAAGNNFTNFVKGTYLETNAEKVVAATIDLTYADEATRTYKVYFMETKRNNETTIDQLVIGSEVAEINEENKTIDITLPNGTNLNSVNLGSSKTTKATMTASYGAGIDFVSPALEWNEDGGRSAAQTFTASSKSLDLTQPITVSVKSEDDINEEFYTLNVNASSEYVDAEITSFTIKNDSIDYFYTAKPDKNGNVTLVVPYEIYDRDQLNEDGWKFFYSKTVGTLATCNNKALPVTGTQINGSNNFAFLPNKIADGTEGASILVRMAGEDLTANTKEYRITIEREKANTVSTLDDFTLVGDKAWEVPGTSYEYAASIDQAKKTITANTSWTAWQYWSDQRTFEGIMEVAENSNAKVFFKNRTGELVEFVNDGSTNPDATDIYKRDSATADDVYDLFNNTKIYVLSEMTWVTLKQNGDLKINYDDTDQNVILKAKWDPDDVSDIKDNLGYFSVYTLTMGNEPAQEGKELKTITLLDGTGWEADLSINVVGGTLVNGQVPYALTTELDANGNIADADTVNPVFLTYDFAEAYRAYVMGRDKSGNPDKDPQSANLFNDYLKVPTAGNKDNDGANLDTTDVDDTFPVTGDAVFYDMAAFSGDWTEDKFQAYEEEGNPFLLISREGDVYIYNYDAGNKKFVKNKEVEPGVLAVCDEDGDAYQEFKFNLKVAEPNAGTTLSEFWFTGFENATTTITADTITVTLPYGTDLNKTEYTYLIPNFDFTADSEGAIVTVDDPALLGKPLRSGVTNVNFTTTRKITVIAENENATRQYTVNVVVADAFSDVEPGDWFYDDVMAAAGFGYVNGMGNGKYEPYGATTRAQFAKILAEALDYDPTAYTTSAFPDVSNDHWAMAAIAFCADQEIILGYDTGNFEPSKTITRQEAALMLQRAFDLQGTESTQYPDDAKIAGWAEDGVYAVKHAGLMKGDADTGNFRPTSTMNRAEMATILMNAHRAGLIK